jgi:uncharacterized protein YbjT (DUF2867 family)
MKYVITGAAGHISKPLAEKLIKAGHDVTVIGRNAENIRSLTDMGAKAAIGSVQDVEFLKRLLPVPMLYIRCLLPTITQMI